MRLFALTAFSVFCGFEQEFNRELDHFIDETQPGLDVASNKHVRLLSGLLVNWPQLMGWTADPSWSWNPQFAAELRRWNHHNLVRLPDANVQLLDLTDEQIHHAALAYEDLRDRSRGDAAIGATAASIILAALRPCALPLWDQAIRMRYGSDGGRESYEAFLHAMQGHVKQLVAEAAALGQTSLETLSRDMLFEQFATARWATTYNVMAETLRYSVRSPETFLGTFTPEYLNGDPSFPNDERERLGVTFSERVEAATDLGGSGSAYYD
jgi:hypothetical protein